ncbi:MAG TPA: hypothetical protein VMY69_08000 [Phycisphaerae bacterium]|nr:hypothetical protein [Phycisphaerae bacterium]
MSEYIEKAVVEVVIKDPDCPPDDLRSIAEASDFEAKAKDKGLTPEQAASALYIVWVSVAKTGTCGFCGRIFRSARKRVAFERQAERPRGKTICPTCFRRIESAQSLQAR